MRPAMSMHLSKEDLAKARQAYDKGYAARRWGAKISDKPDDELNEWMFGWKDADELYT